MQVVMTVTGEKTTHEISELKGQCPTLDAFLEDDYVTEMTTRSAGHGFIQVTYRKIGTPQGDMCEKMSESADKTSLFLGLMKHGINHSL
jgi:hypothetical protein